ncbi:hypothetical protein Tco_0656028 [Tanacetum coccineum]|uniref:Reverse transcriptase Ty1/copia-type domain-containing protein n=1 Tax=Tanacetum coccineum TaxID=301880 RepID=A0ABQ4X7N4_9ASTR
MTRKLDDMIEMPKSQPKRTYNEDLECEIVMVKIPKCMAWLDDEPIGYLDTIEDEVDDPSPQSTPQVLPSFEVYTPLVTYPEDVDETIGILMEVEPLDHTKLEDLGLNTCNHDIPLSSREIPSVDEPEPQPLPNLPLLHVNLGDKRGTDPPINPYSPGIFRMKVKQKEDGIFLSQDKYVAEILEKFDFMSMKTASTPIKTHKPLVKDEEAADVDVHLYRFQVTPKTSHLHAVKRIFRYLKGKPKLGLWYPKETSFDLVAYSDSDYGGANLDRKSITGGCQFLGHRLISWQCKKQTIVATSTTEAEYVAAANCHG